MISRPIIQVLDQLTNCQEDTKHLFGSLFRPLKLDRKSALNTTEPSASGLYFIQDGLLHLFKESSNAQTPDYRSTIEFYLPKSFFWIHPTVTTPSLFLNIAAIRESQLLFAHISSITAICQSSPESSKIVLDLQQHLASQIFQKIDLLHTEPALERYKAASQHLGHYFFQIPKRHLASYLGISRKHLNRINAQLLRGEKT